MLTVFEFIAQTILEKKKKRDKPLETEALPSKPALNTESISNSYKVIIHMTYSVHFW